MKKYKILLIPTQMNRKRSNNEHSIFWKSNAPANGTNPLLIYCTSFLYFVLHVRCTLIVDRSAQQIYSPHLIYCRLPTQEGVELPSPKQRPLKFEWGNESISLFLRVSFIFITFFTFLQSTTALPRGGRINVGCYVTADLFNRSFRKGG